MSDPDWLAESFDAERPRLRAVAHRMLGSRAAAEDAVQEAWIRLSRTNPGDVENLGGWLTTVVSRVCLDVLRARRARGEEPLEEGGPGKDAIASGDPEREAILVEGVGLALLVVLETLSPAERIAFVLHDLFDLPFDEIASIMDRTPEAARQLASRARRRVRGAPSVPDPDATRRREVVEAFLRASREGDFEALLSMLDPDAVFQADGAAVGLGAPKELVGARAIAEMFEGRARAGLPALIEGVPGYVWAPGGRPRSVIRLTMAGERISGFTVIGDPEHIRELDIVLLEG